MEAILFIGIQASGKSTFYQQRFIDTHIRINLDMLKTRHRERLLIQACHVAKQPYVIDNTNPTRADRNRYVEPAKSHGFRVVAYYFSSGIEQCKARNAGRDPETAVPLRGLLGTYSRLELPNADEGFDQMYHVHIDDHGSFHVEDWRDEVR